MHVATFPDLTTSAENKKLPFLLFLNEIYKLMLQFVFPEFCTALRIFITLPMIVVSGERGLSKLLLIENPLTSTFDQEKLNHIALFLL